MAKTTQKEQLGRGIRALLGDISKDLKEDDIIGQEQEHLGNVVKVPLEKIEVNPFQPRVNFDEEALKELSDSIKIHGVVQPITVRKINKDKYQLISGERRLRASKMAGLKEVPVYIRTANDQESLEIALIENIQREDLNAIEIGINYQRLLDECDLSHEALAERIGKKRTTVTNYLRLLKLPPDIQVGIRSGSITMGHARALAGLDDIVLQLSIFKDIVSKDLSVRQVEDIVKKLSDKKSNASSNKNKKDASKPISPELRKYQDKIASHFSTKVVIKETGKGKGEIILNYYTNDDLERIMDLMK